MTCSSCQHENRPGAKFCGGCGGSLKAVCAKCGTELPPDIRFCDECGTPVPGAASAAHSKGEPEAAGARKIVTLLFADLAGSTALHERLDPESARRFMESYYALAREAVESHGGTLAKLLGDGAMAVFGIPRVAEDDAIRAVRAGVAMQEAFRALAEQQRGLVGETGLRVAVNTGEVVVKGETEIIGDPVNVAARLQERGQNGDVVIGEATRRLVSSQVTLEFLGSLELKGRAKAVKGYRVVSLAATGRAAAPFVGREEELARITAVFDRAVAEQATRLAVLLGSPGLGKSRLIEEFARRSGDAATVIEANCDAAGGATFAPLADALRELLAIETGASPDSVRAAIEAALPRQHAEGAQTSEGERTRVVTGIAAIVAGTPGAPEETFFVVRRFLAGLATSCPVVLVVDDLQWGEPLLFDLLEHLVQWGRALPLLVLVGARPELREVRSSFATPGGMVSDVVGLSSLDASVAMRLAAGVVGASDLPAAVAAKVLATSEGNPLFIGELVRMLVDEGALVRTGDRWTTGEALETVEMPPTIHALLAARIERLEPAQCVVLERAAIVGRQFSRSAVASLLGENRAGPGTGEAGSLDAHLEALQRAQLIERDTGWLLGEPVLRFHHMLIRDAAYRRLLKGTRAELHERLANWIEGRVGEATEHDETIGRHLEEAHRLLGELGPVDAAGERLGERAATRLAAAGRRALDSNDVPLAAGLLGRALERRGENDPARADLALDWCEALLATGDVATATSAIDELALCIERAEASASSASGSTASASASRLRAWHACFLGHHTVLTAPAALSSTAEQVAEAAASLALLDDAAGEANAHYVHALALARLGRVGACETSLDQALAAARRAGDRRRANTVLAIAPVAALWGPSAVTRASGRCLDVVRVLRITRGAPAVEAVALSCQGVLEALRGRTDAARRMIASGRAMVEELGIAPRLFETDVFAGFVTMLEGDAPAAEETLRGAYDGLRELGLGIDAARAAAMLARALLAQGGIEEAEALSHESEALAGDDLKAAIAWRGVRAEALARRGEHAAAIEFATAAVEIAAATDALLDHADARLALATALGAAGRSAEAATEQARAIELWEAKGATLLAGRARNESAPKASASEGAGPGSISAVRRRPVRDNWAVEETRRIEAAVDSKDVQALVDVYLPDAVVDDHMHGVEYGGDKVSERVRFQIQESTGGAFRHETLATLGDAVGLFRMRALASGSDVYGTSIGETESVYILVIEADEKGCARRIDIYGENALGQAVACLYRRYAESLPEGPERTRAAGIGHGLSVLQGRVELERLPEIYTEDLRLSDHRVFATWSSECRDDLAEHFRQQLALVEEFSVRTDDVLALGPDAIVERLTYYGIGRDSGGVFENRICVIYRFGWDGRIARIECYEAERAADALSHFDSLVASAGGGRKAAEQALPAAQRRVRPNGASRSVLRVQAGMVARDREAVDRTLGDQVLVVDHPTGTTWGREGQMESVDRVLRMPDVEFRMEPLATLGKSLGLARRRVLAAGTAGGRFDVAEYETDNLVINEVDHDERVRRSEVFAADRLGDAIVRLFESHAELQPEGPQRERATAAAHTVRMAMTPFAKGRMAHLGPDIELVDHRKLGTWNAVGAADATKHLSSLGEVASDAVVHNEEVLALEPDAFLLRRLHTGIERTGGGSYERHYLLLAALGPGGELRRVEFFDVGDEARALARFDEIAGLAEAGSAAQPFENAASKADRRFVGYFNARDWSSIESMAAPVLVFDERRRMMHNTCGREVWLEQLRVMFDVPLSRFTTKLRATRGQRLALSLHTFAGEVAGGGGPLAMDDHLVLHEVDGDGRLVAIVLFDLDAEGAAYAELDDRYEAEQGERLPASWNLVRRWTRAVADRDWENVASLVADDFVELDHRGLSLFGVTRGVENWVQVIRAVSDLAPDSAFRVRHFVPGARGYYQEGGFVGTREGGEFEIVLNSLVEIGDHELVKRVDVYDDDRVFTDRRWAELGIPALSFVKGAATQDHAAAAAGSKPNPASAALNRWLQTYRHGYETGNWEPMRETCAPGCSYSDRRRLNLLEGDVEMLLASVRERAASGASVDLTPLGAAGDRLIIQRVLWSGGPADGPFEIEYLALTELDSSDQIAAFVLFDLEDARSAQREAWARWAAIDPDVAAVVPLIGELADSFNQKDAAGWRAVFTDDVVVEDHRLAGMGRIEGADAYTDTVVALWELAPVTRGEVGWWWEAVARHGGITVTRRTGAVPDGGGDFESEYLYLFVLDGGRIARVELFEMNALDRALARFEELRPQEPASAPGP